MSAVKATYITLAIAVAALALITIVSGTRNVYANPSQFYVAKSAAATTTLSSYMTPGNATTTAAFDTQGDGGLPTDSAYLATQFVASSTLTYFRWRYEYADNTTLNGAVVDCTSTPTQCDWYAGAQVNTYTTTATATTTPYGVTATPLETFFNFASTSQGAAQVLSTNNRSLFVYSVETPMRYVRVVFYLPTGSANGAVWTEWVGKKQSR